MAEPSYQGPIYGAGLSGPVYKARRYGNGSPFVYNLTPAPGVYTLALKFADWESTNIGNRVMDITINGSVYTGTVTNEYTHAVTPNVSTASFDIYAYAQAMNTAVTLTIPGVITNGTLLISFNRTSCTGSCVYPQQVNAILLTYTAPVQVLTACSNTPYGGGNYTIRNPDMVIDRVPCLQFTGGTPVVDCSGATLYNGSNTISNNDQLKSTPAMIQIDSATSPILQNCTFDNTYWYKAHGYNAGIGSAPKGFSISNSTGVSITGNYGKIASARFHGSSGVVKGNRFDNATALFVDHSNNLNLGVSTSIPQLGNGNDFYLYWVDADGAQHGGAMVPLTDYTIYLDGSSNNVVAWNTEQYMPGFNSTRCGGMNCLQPDRTGYDLTNRGRDNFVLAEGTAGINFSQNYVKDPYNAAVEFFGTNSGWSITNNTITNAGFAAFDFAWGSDADGSYSMTGMTFNNNLVSYSPVLVILAPEGTRSDSHYDVPGFAGLGMRTWPTIPLRTITFSQDRYKRIITAAVTSGTSRIRHL